MSKDKPTRHSLDHLIFEFYRIYGRNIRTKSMTDLCIRMVRDVGLVHHNCRRQKTDATLQGLAQVFSDLCVITGKLRDKSPENRMPKELSLRKTLPDVIWERYPGFCPFCFNAPCLCTYYKLVVKSSREKRLTSKSTADLRGFEARKPQTLDEWVKLAYSIFGESIRSQPPLDLIGHLMEETVDLLSLGLAVEQQEGEVRHLVEGFYKDLAGIFMRICSIAAKLNSDSGKTFSVIVKHLLCATESRNGNIEHLRSFIFQSTASRGRDLERIAKQTFSLVPGFEVLERKRTATGEIDLIIRNVNDHPLFRSLGTHILVECKSSEDPVSKKEVVDFIDKIKSHRCRSGILVTLSRVSGKKGRDALGKIKEAFDRNGTILMTFTLEDLERIHLGEAATRIFFEKHEGVKFM